MVKKIAAKTAKKVPSTPLGKALKELTSKPKKKVVTLADIAKAGVKKIVKDAKAADKEAAASWEAADAELKKEAAAKKAHAPSVLPVESDKPGIARNPKPPKVVQPLTADGSLVPLEIISYHFLKLMERLAAEHGGTSAQALEDLKADIARRKTP